MKTFILINAILCTALTLYCSVFDKEMSVATGVLMLLGMLNPFLAHNKNEPINKNEEEKL
jgi:UDP-N-acetylmuramyl pentapeptide phosphotransferase/UDP-N-acetylglucosamine-1-phosphate transferase